jgi:hypothetical protein
MYIVLRKKSTFFTTTGYFTSDNEPGGIEIALERTPGYRGDKDPAFPPDVL